MAFDANVTVKGDKELIKELDRMGKDLHGSRMGGAMGKATLVIARTAKKNAPVDTGVLRASITPEVVFRTERVMGIVGSNVKYAPYQELGTRPHTPPKGVIWRWAMRKSKGNRAAASALFVRAWISIRTKGVIAKRYLQQALEDNADRVFRYIERVVHGIIREE